MFSSHPLIIFPQSKQLPIIVILSPKYHNQSPRIPSSEIHQQKSPDERMREGVSSVYQLQNVLISCRINSILIPTLSTGRLNFTIALFKYTTTQFIWQR